jgi:PadR family transcriptional regulator, regulatory protein PadR
MSEEKVNILQGTLGLMVLRTLDVLGPMHGYGIGRRIEQVSEGTLSLNQGTLYPALLQLQQAGWVKAKWGLSETNRKVKFYSITPTGRKQLSFESEKWRRVADVIERFAEPSKGTL